MGVREERLINLGFNSYAEFLKSSYWEYRKYIYCRNLNPIEVCDICRVSRWICSLIYGKDLNLHHKTYERLGQELDEDLQLLCERCHQIKHKRSTYLPKITLTACRRCKRPKLQEIPSLSFRPIPDLEHVTDIIRKWDPYRRDLTKKDEDKIIELIRHTGC